MIDENSLIKHYYAIANKLDDIMPVEWDKIIMYAEETGTSSTPSFYFHAKDDDRFYYSKNIPEEFFISEDIFEELLLELKSCIKGLWYEFKRSGEKTWYTLTIRFEVTGKFDVEFGYKLDKEIDYYKRKLVWAYNELGILPVDKDDRGFVEEYVSKKL